MKFALVLMQDGRVWSSGDNDEGGLGDGTMEDQHFFQKVINSGVKSIETGKLLRPEWV